MLVWFLLAKINLHVFCRLCPSKPCHDKRPCQGTAKTAFSRFTVSPTATATAKYCPARLSDANAAEMQQKRAVLGATFLGRLTSLRVPSNPCKILWEIDLCAEPPAMYRPVKPKLYFVGEITLKKGRYYRLL